MLRGVRYQLTIYSKNVLIKPQEPSLKPESLTVINCELLPRDSPFQLFRPLPSKMECKGIFQIFKMQVGPKNIFKNPTEYKSTLMRDSSVYASPSASL